MLAGAGSLFGGLFGANAARDAAKTQAQAAREATQAQLGIFGTEQGNLAPFLNTGTNALRSLSGLLGLENVQGVPTGALNQSPRDLLGLGAPPTLGTANLSIPDPSNPATIAQFQQSPSYQYNLDQSSKAIQNSAAGKTGALSGNMLQALQKNAVGLAGNDYYNWLNSATNYGQQNFNAQTQNLTSLFNSQNSNYWNQYNAGSQEQGNLFQRLLALAVGGQNAGVNLGTAGTALGGQVGQNIIGGGQAIAAGRLGGAGALTGGINQGINNILGGAYGQANQSGMSLAGLISQLFGGGGIPEFSGIGGENVGSFSFG